MRIPVRPLLLAGVVGPLLFIAVFLIEGLTRPGYSAWRNFVSQLATGDGGWVQVANFLVCGTLVLGFSAGLVQAMDKGRGATASAVLLGAFALSLIVAGILVTDLALGYPVGAPVVHTTHGLIHGLAGLAAFTILPAAALVMAWHFGGDPASRRWAIYSAAVGLPIIACFIGGNVLSVLDAQGTLPNAPTGFVQRIAIIAGWTWIALVALHFLRQDELKNRA
jgi:hypothetical protein